MRNVFEFAELSKDIPVSDVENHVLLKEMSHRIKNEYACVINTIWLRAHKSQSTEVRTALSDVATLLIQLSDVHRALTFPDGQQPMDVCAYLQRLWHGERIGESQKGLRWDFHSDPNLEIHPVESQVHQPGLPRWIHLWAR